MKSFSYTAINLWGVTTLLLLLFVLLLQQPRTAGCEGVSATVNAYGQIVSAFDSMAANKEAGRCSSSDGQFCAEYRFKKSGFDHFHVSRLDVLYQGKHVVTIVNPVGSGFYISNSGLVAAVDADESPSGKGRLTFYSSSGELLFHQGIRFAHDFCFSPSGEVFAFNSADGLILVIPQQKAISTFAEAELFALSTTGDSIIILNERCLSFWHASGKVADFAVDLDWPRKLAFAPRGHYIAAIGKSQLKVMEIPSGKLLFQKVLPAGESYRDVEWQNGKVMVGIQQRNNDTSQGLLRSYDLNEVQIDSNKTDPKALPKFREDSEKRLLKPAGRDTIFWPLAPFNKVYPIGNTYEEYQDYGGDPYPHPGVDMLAPDSTPVFSVSEGVVKAVLTISAEYHWRIAIGDSDTARPSEGWLYAHLVQNSIPFAVGDSVHAMDFLGELVPWPISNFTHCHFVKISDSGSTWSMPWDAVFNPLEVLRPNTDMEPPIFHPAKGKDTLAFCVNESSMYLDPFALVGKVDIIAKVGDYLGHPDWECSPYRLEYELLSLPSGNRVLGPIYSMTFSHVIPAYTGTAQMTHVLYKNDQTCNSGGDYNNRDFFLLLTNTDGDSILELSDADSSLDTAQFNDGPYRVIVRAYDAGGNVTSAGMDVEFVNGVTNVAGKRAAIPFVFRTSQNFPNPFNGSTTFPYEIARPRRLVWSIFDLAGRTIFSQEVAHSQTGQYQWTWSARDKEGKSLPSGIYFAKAEMEGHVQMIKVAITK